MKDSTEFPEKPIVQIKSLANVLHGLAYTLKQPRDVPADRIKPHVA